MKTEYEKGQQEVLSFIDNLVSELNCGAIDLDTFNERLRDYKNLISNN